MHALSDERALIKSLKSEARWFSDAMPDIRVHAGQWVRAVRAKGAPGAVAALLSEYGLSSEEGILLMCLAEALLRIPDTKTADALIKDKLSPGDWDAHIGLGRPWFISAAGQGLEVSAAIADRQRLAHSCGAFLAGLIHRLGEPVVRMALRHAMKLMGEAFVFAQDIQHAQQHAVAWREKSYLFSFDMLGEGARTEAQAEAYLRRYEQAIDTADAMAGDSVSIKLSALHPRLELRKYTQVKRELLPKLEALAVASASRGVPLTIDAEEAARLDITLELFEALRGLPSLAHYDGLGLAVQAYNVRAHQTLMRLKALSERCGQRIPVRLVKGAYWDGEIKRAQMEGLAMYPVFTRKTHTDISYLACAEYLLAHPAHFYPQFATHNALSVAAILARGKEGGFEFQRLHGMGEALYEAVKARHGVDCRIYAPVGPPKELLSYLIRRILENGANSSFVRALSDSAIMEEELLADPFTETSDAAIAAPPALYGVRKNSLGSDLGELQTLARWRDVLTQEIPLPLPQPRQVGQAYDAAKKAFTAWSLTSVEERAQRLERAADAMEEAREELVSLLVAEAKKTLADAIAEVREAVDFCRYYAEQARRVFAAQPLPGPVGEKNVLRFAPRGTIVAISPWNFPLAIFTGQITAALAAGNCVLAKPAEQTPGIAMRAVALLHQAGVPQDALQLVVGAGEKVGAALVAHPGCAGVVFTGSTATARAIHRALAQKDGPIVPLIAETGGQNCMVVDASALIEHTVDDMVVSAFYSAGQRCSALRVAFVQEEIADALIVTLAGAMEALKVGDPRDVATDIGPVIDEEAAIELRAHIARMQKEAKLLAATPLPPDAPLCLIAPHVFEITQIHALQQEVFGPVLHLIRYRQGTLDAVIEQINATGYGLTFGIQSRIDATIEKLSNGVRAGNIYVNRPMTGAVVGVQPFGGEGLSGTGPKAGGPHYLQRFCVERVSTTNTAAIGGNIELLAQKHAP